MKDETTHTTCPGAARLLRWTDKASGSLKQYNLVIIHDVLSQEIFVIDFAFVAE